MKKRGMKSATPMGLNLGVLLLGAILLLGCTASSESQDEFTGNAPIPEPDTFVDSNFAGHNGGTAKGEIIELSGTIVNEAGEALPGAIVYIHQTDANGRYIDQAKRADAYDEHFQYDGWIRTDENGRFTLRTIAPGAYVGSDSMVPHIHIYARHEDKQSYYKSINFPQYPPRNDDMDYVDRDDKWGLVIDLEKADDPDVKYTGEFQLTAYE